MRVISADGKDIGPEMTKTVQKTQVRFQIYTTVNACGARFKAPLVLMGQIDLPEPVCPRHPAEAADGGLQLEKP